MSIMASSSIHERVIKIGSKGEIFPPKELRESLGLHPDVPVIIFQYQDTLIVRKIYSLEEILKKEPKLRISYHALKQLDNEIRDSIEN